MVVFVTAKQGFSSRDGEYFLFSLFIYMNFEILIKFFKQIKL